MFNRSFRPNGSKVDYLQPKKLQMQQQEVEKKTIKKTDVIRVLSYELNNPMEPICRKTNRSTQIKYFFC